ncbi:MAG: ATP-grasp domain-containing protein [Rhodobacteraceae bacterium]|nr:ATP-grasp domain-containing protein [Paracoccaceae bacterium]
MIQKVLIANRGEIACRIIRTARRMGIATVAIHADVDAESPHVEMADEAIALEPPSSARCYLDIDRIVEAALTSSADSVHPGYGFLSENPEFAAHVAQAGLTFVGPPVETIRVMGLKDIARARMIEAGVPVVPGFPEHGCGESELAGKATEIGFPVLVKPVAGGGGIGMKSVDGADELPAAVAAAKREAAAAFGNEAVVIEKLIDDPRHVEIQVFADRHGNVVHTFERDCSLQRRHQKLVEEAPAPGMQAHMRNAITSAAISATSAVGYVGAGTVEFIADASDGLRSDRFWFLEMNTRLQVEHPVTEEVTGIDLVEWQFRVAAGERIPVKQERIGLKGHAIEARLYAEDPANGFLPSPGRIALARFPDAKGVRVESGVRSGSQVPSEYDPLIAKIIASGKTREDARLRLVEALDATRVAGVRTNRTFLRELVRTDAFTTGQMTTGTVNRAEDLAVVPSPHQEILVIAAVVAAGIPEGNDWAFGFALWQPLFRRIVLIVDGMERQFGVSVTSSGECTIGDGSESARVRAVSVDRWDVNGLPINAIALRSGDFVRVHGRHDWQFELPVQVDPGRDDHAGLVDVRAPMTGRIASVHVQPGDRVEAGSCLATMEAMKMEHSLEAAQDSKVTGVMCTVGRQVREGELLISLDPIQ